MKVFEVINLLAKIPGDTEFVLEEHAPELLAQRKDPPKDPEKQGE